MISQRDFRSQAKCLMKKNKRNGFEARFRSWLRANPSVRCDFSYFSFIFHRSSVRIREECVCVCVCVCVPPRLIARFARTAFELHGRRTRVFFLISAPSFSSARCVLRTHFTAILPGLSLVRSRVFPQSCRDVPPRKDHREFTRKTPSSHPSSRMESEVSIADPSLYTFCTCACVCV